jgi:ribosome-associated protein
VRPPDLPPAPDERTGPSGWLRVAPGCVIREDEIRWRFLTSGGPGGQHANRAATRVEARFDVAASRSLDEAQRERIIAKLGPVVTVAVDDTRSQGRNRRLAVQRLCSRLARALDRPAPRRPTKPSKRAAERRLEAKRHRSETKRGRRLRPPSED